MLAVQVCSSALVRGWSEDDFGLNGNADGKDDDHNAAADDADADADDNDDDYGDAGGDGDDDWQASWPRVFLGQMRSHWQLM